MFKRWLIARIPVSRDLWEPIRYLYDVGHVSIYTLSNAFGITEDQVAKVIVAAWSRRLDEGEEVSIETLMAGVAP